MKISMINYHLFNYTDVDIEKFPFSFQSYYVNYINDTLNGKVFIFEFEKFYICFSLRSNFRFKFIHFISEVFSINSNHIDYHNFYKVFKQYCVLNKIIAVYPPQHLFTYREYPFSSKFYPLGIISLSLRPSIDEIYSNFKPVYRRHIRNAEKAGVVVEIGNHLFDQFYGFYEANMLKNKAIYDKKNDLIKILNAAQSNAICAVARLNGAVEAVILNLHDHNKAYYMWGASGKGAHNGSFRLLHWELIQYYKKKGLFSYSLGGYRSNLTKTKKQEQLENFKLGFGATINEGYHFIWVLRPLLNSFYNRLSYLIKFLKK